MHITGEEFYFMRSKVMVVQKILEPFLSIYLKMKPLRKETILLLYLSSFRNRNCEFIENWGRPVLTGCVKT